MAVWWTSAPAPANRKACASIWTARPFLARIRGAGPWRCFWLRSSRGCDLHRRSAALRLGHDDNTSTGITLPLATSRSLSLISMAKQHTKVWIGIGKLFDPTQVHISPTFVQD